MGTVLHLTLMRKWFIAILRGTKKIEYREIKPYWTKRLSDKDGNSIKYNYIIFKNGYSKNAPEMKVEFLGLKKKQEYEIILGKILDKKNVQNL
jgi:hypothetical protein